MASAEVGGKEEDQTSHTTPFGLRRRSSADKYESLAVTSESETSPKTWEALPTRVRRSRIYVVRSPDPAAKGRPIELDGGERIIGRDSEAGVTIQDDGVSRRHLKLTRAQSGDFLIEDLETRNGSYLNGSPVVSSTQISAGDVISLGESLLVVDQEPDPFQLLASPSASGDLVPEIVGVSYYADRLRRCIATVAQASGHVVIFGETGTGKEVTARAIHRLSTPTASLSILNCAAIPPTLAEAELFGVGAGAYTGAVARRGSFAEADGGVLFLDEVEELSVEVQAKLLRALDDGSIQPLGAESVQVNTRVVAATNLELASGRARQDFLARWRWKIRLPKLRERRADILLLFEHFSTMARKSRSLPARTLAFDQALLLYPWPDNIRELKTFAENLVDFYPPTETLGLAALNEEIYAAYLEKREDFPPPDSEEERAEIERGGPEANIILQRIAEHGGNKSKAAASFGVGRTTLYRWLRERGIDPRTV